MDDGVTVLLTTQYLEEADLLADTVVVLDGGRVALDGTHLDRRERRPRGERRPRAVTYSLAILVVSAVGASWLFRHRTTA